MPRERADEVIQGCPEPATRRDNQCREPHKALQHSAFRIIEQSAGPPWLYVGDQRHPVRMRLQTQIARSAVLCPDDLAAKSIAQVRSKH